MTDEGAPASRPAPPLRLLHLLRAPSGRRRRVLLTALALALLLVGIAGWSALSAARLLERAADTVAAADAGPADVPSVLAALRAADADITRARAVLDRPPVRLGAVLPLVGRSLRAERAAARAAGDAVAAAAILVEAAPGLSKAGGRLDLTAARRLEQRLAAPVARARDSLARLQSVPTWFTPPPVGAGVRQSLVGLEPAVRRLEDATAGLELARGLLGGAGPRSLLVALGNNAELRGAGGYVSSFATGRTDGGRLTLDPLRDVTAVADGPAASRRVPAPPDYLEDFGPLSGNTTMFRSWNMSPDFPASAEVGARVAEELLGRPVDLVMLVDVPGMARLAGLSGAGVTLGDGTVIPTAELERALLVDSYAQAGTDGTAQGERRAQLQSAATVAVTRLLTGDVPALQAVRTLGALAQGRHLSVWSGRPAEQAALERLGLAGELAAPPAGDLLHVSVNNIGADKLDYYVERDVSLDVQLSEQTAHVVQRVRLENAAPAGLVPYVAGVTTPGTLTSRLELSLAPTASVASVLLDGAPAGARLRGGTARTRVSVRVEIPRGATRTLEVRYDLPTPQGRYEVQLIPQALARDAQLEVRVVRSDGRAVADVTGADVVSGRAERRGPWSVREELTAATSARPHGALATLRQRVSRFWSRPVELG